MRLVTEHVMLSEINCERPSLLAEQLNDVLVAIASMDREELIEQFQTYPAPFPIDFTEAFLRAQSVDKLRHVFAGLVMHCRIAPQVGAHALRFDQRLRRSVNILMTLTHADETSRAFS